MVCLLYHSKKAPPGMLFPCKREEIEQSKNQKEQPEKGSFPDA